MISIRYLGHVEIILATSLPEVPGKDSLENVLVEIAGRQGASLTRVYKHAMGVGQPPIGVVLVLVMYPTNFLTDKRSILGINENNYST